MALMRPVDSEIMICQNLKWLHQLTYLIIGKTKFVPRNRVDR